MLILSAAPLAICARNVEVALTVLPGSCVRVGHSELDRP
jgi:hypothetical protein